MKILILLIFLATMANAHNDRFKRFVGGKKAKIAQFPYLASLRFTQNNGHFCGGSIVSDQHVLTAAHCLIGKTSKDFFIAVGSINLSKITNKYLVEEHIIHPQFNNESFVHDIAVIKIKPKFEFSKHIQKIPLSKISKIYKGTSMTISGFGRKTYYGQVSDSLQYSEVTTISNKWCKLKLFWLFFDKHEVTKYNICTLDKKIGFCKGDSGGPLVYNGEQVGIVSWMVAKCAADYPDIYTKVAPHFDWINDYMGLEEITESVETTTKQTCKRKFWKISLCFV